MLGGLVPFDHFAQYRAVFNLTYGVKLSAR
jgi:hypothetical protein